MSSQRKGLHRLKAQSHSGPFAWNLFTVVSDFFFFLEYTPGEKRQEKQTKAIFLFRPLYTCPFRVPFTTPFLIEHRWTLRSHKFILILIKGQFVSPHLSPVSLWLIKWICSISCQVQSHHHPLLCVFIVIVTGMLMFSHIWWSTEALVWRVWGECTPVPAQEAAFV